MADPTGRVTNLIGYLVKISAPGKRTHTGVVLPPKPGARNRGLRLAVSADRAIAFDPAQWTIAVQHDDEYSWGNLPLELLAARTALRIEHHREPAPDQKSVAIYKLRRDIADLYAIVDTKPLPALSPKRAAAWTAARTCARCAKQTPRPLPQRPPERTRYCSDCAATVAFERWCEQSRAAQAETAQWARDVLDDPAAILIATDRGWNIRHMRAETVKGALLFDVRVRSIDDIDSGWYQDTPEKKAERHQRYAGTIGPDEFAEAVMPLADTRMIGWYYGDASTGTGYSLIPHIKRDDQVSERLALFSGVAPQRHGYWFPTPQLPWSHYPPTYVPYTSHRALYDGSLITQIAHLRTLLNLMAHNTPPPPSWVDPATRKVVIAAPSIDRGERA
jgi:hypothetical protein